MALSCSKKLPTLLRGTTSKNHGHFYCLNCLYYFATENKLESHKKYVKIKIFITLPTEDTKILEFNQYQHSDKAPFINYANLEYLIETIDRCKNNPKN